jgi:hypothetical protein
VFLGFSGKVRKPSAWPENLPPDRRGEVFAGRVGHKTMGFADFSLGKYFGKANRGLQILGVAWMCLKKTSNRD